MRVGAGLAMAYLALTLVGGDNHALASHPLRYAALGDSLTASCWVTPTCWVNTYASDLNADLHVDTSTTNLGVYGATSAQLLNQAEHDSVARAAIAGADVVTYDGGFNDFVNARVAYLNGTCGGADDQDCLRAMVASFDSNWDRLVSEIRALAPGAMRRTMTTYYSVSAFDEAHGYYDALNPYLSQINAHILSDPEASVADVHLAYNGASGADDPITKGYILPDNVHPTEVGHAVIADLVRGFGYRELTSN
jgi:lysophospholipase L1-like esterase